jgi:hypothetical protein
MNNNDGLTIKGDVKFVFKNAKTGEITSVVEVKNLFVTAGKNSIADRLRGNASKGEITYCAVGTSGTAVAAGDTQLGTELFRKLISVRSVSNNVATFETFYNESEGNGTLAEAGLFGDAATSTANSGTLFCHTLISKTKTSSDTLSIIWTVTIG